MFVKVVYFCFLHVWAAALDLGENDVF